MGWRRGAPGARASGFPLWKDARFETRTFLPRAYSAALARAAAAMLASQSEVNLIKIRLLLRIACALVSGTLAVGCAHAPPPLHTAKLEVLSTDSGGVKP